MSKMTREENRLISVSENGIIISEFVYDGDGNRVKKTENGETVIYVNKYYEKNLTTGVFTTSYYLGGQLIAQRENTTLKYIHQDHLTSTSLMTNNTGGSLGTIKYYPFGTTKAGSVPTDKLFTGQRLDTTELYYYGARYYDPEIGRFISADTTIPDSLNPQSYNRYSYCINNPLKFFDPSGLDYLLVGGSNSTEDDMEKWKAQLVDQSLLAEGEQIYVLWDNDREAQPITIVDKCDVKPRYAQLDNWLSNPTNAEGDSIVVTDLKIIGHSEGAATVGTYVAEWLHPEGNSSQSATDLLNSQLSGVFLVDCPIGISSMGLWNYRGSKLNGVGKELEDRGIKSADIYNSYSFARLGFPLSGWDSYNVASWNDGIFGFFAWWYNHNSTKKDSLPVIKQILQE
jgi:RHS repeat-associated protein